jgi:hypothetical protein
MDSVAHARVVLGRVVGAGGSLKALHYAADHLGGEHFTDKVQRTMFLTLVAYADRNGGVMTRAGLGDLLSGREPGIIQMYEEAYSLLAGLSPEEHEFYHSVSQLREQAADRATGDALAVGMTIMKEGLTLEDGTKLQGHADTRAYVLSEFAQAETAAGATDSPGGDIRAAGDDILAAYTKVKEQRSAGRVQGIEFGIPALDAHLDGGLGHGEMGLVAAAMTAGKSSWCVQCGWYNAVEQGKHVIFFTTEQHHTALQIKIVARHSRHPKFGLERGLDTRLIRSGRLGEEGERALAAVVSDLKTGDYGSLQVIQMPELCTLSVMAARAEAISRVVVPDLVIFDYLQLLDPERRSKDNRLNETMAGSLKGARSWARSFRRGRGVPLISPWQVNKEGINGMKGSGEFKLEDLGETIEAGRTPSMVLGLMASEDDTSAGRAAPLTAKVLKHRDGPRGRKFPLTVDFATCYFADREGMAPEEGFLDLGGI